MAHNNQSSAQIYELLYEHVPMVHESEVREVSLEHMNVIMLYSRIHL